MNSLQMRFDGGPMHGRTLWLEKGRDSVNVQVADATSGQTRVYQYRLNGPALQFVSEVEATRAPRPSPSPASRVPETSRSIPPQLAAMRRARQGSG